MALPSNTDLSDDRQVAKSRRRRARRRWLLLSVFALVAVAAVTSGRWLPLLMMDADERAMALKRSDYRWRASMGMALPGTPDLANLDRRLAEHGLTMGAPILMRIFKREFELELWMKRDGVFHRFVTYPICRWSGTLGPKHAQGDRQAPEGVYAVDKTALNPNSRWYRSFNLGFPNAYDRALGRNGTFLMVHGGCASIGCYAMTNAQMDEIWRIVTAALDGGQPAFQVQIYPFRMSSEALDNYADNPNARYWRDLKAGNDLFEKTLQPLRVSVCDKRYVFSAGSNEGDPRMADRCPPASAKK
ncbi:MAG: L,D-transpeptidase family protein [Hyphomicrobium sp.]